jgi:type I restriction enzyme, S subunit
VNLRSHPYKSYKTSNSEWCDQIPIEWNEKRVKDIFRLVTDKAADDNDHELLSLYAGIGVRPRKDLEARGNKASSTDGYWLVRKGDIIVNKLLAWMGSVGLSEYEGVTSPAYDVLRKTSKLVDARYFSYLFRTEIAKQIFKRNSRGIMDMRLRLYFDKLGAITVPVPPLSTQQAIAAYIDTKTSQIDRQIDLLTKKAMQYVELKQSLICVTITRGLDRSVQMKDSGIEFVGEVPAHWKVKRFKEVFNKTHSGWTPDTSKRENFEGENIWVTIRDMDGNNHISNSENKLSDEAIAKSGILKTPKGSLLFSFKLSIGKIAFAGCDLYTNEAIISIENEPKVNLNYFFYALPIFLVLNAKENIYGAKLLNQGIIFNTFLLYPPKDEQAAIAAYLDEKTAHIEQIVKSINSQIDKLKDLRKVLISDAVTGKIKVTNEG